MNFYEASYDYVWIGMNQFSFQVYKKTVLTCLNHIIMTSKFNIHFMYSINEILKNYLKLSYIIIHLNGFWYHDINVYLYRYGSRGYR